MDYQAWDAAIQDAITSLPDAQATSRSQRFIKQFPTALTLFRAKLATTVLAIPLAEFQRHPTYLLRWLLAQWKDEETKTIRTDIALIMTKSAESIQQTQSWRSGQGDNWALWGFKNMDDLYNNYKTPPDQASKLQSWYFQRFCGLDASGHPVHFELLPNTYEKDLILPFSIRRIVNNEHTLRHRIPLLNPPATERLSDPVLGATWILDARNLSIWSSSQIYKTANALSTHSIKITSMHYPEQGFRAVVLNLGVVWGSMYHMLMRVMPATTQATTKCYIGSDVLEQVMGSWDNVPCMFKKGQVRALTRKEEEEVKDDAGPFDQ